MTAGLEPPLVTAWFTSTAPAAGSITTDGSSLEGELARERLRVLAGLAAISGPVVLGNLVFHDLLRLHRVLGAVLLVVPGCAGALAVWMSSTWFSRLSGDTVRSQLRIASLGFVTAALASSTFLAATWSHAGVSSPGARSEIAIAVMFGGALLSPAPLAAFPFTCIAGATALAETMAAGARSAFAPSQVAAMLVGVLLWIALSARLFREHVGRHLHAHAHQALTETLLADYEHGSSDWLWEATPAGGFRMSLRPGGSLHAMRAAEGLDWIRYIREGATDGHLAEADFRRVRHAVQHGRPFRDCVLPIEAGDARYWWSLAGRPIVDEAGRVIGYRGVASDVTERRRAEQRAAHLACHDEVTGLLNRATFGERVAAATASGAAFDLVMIDLDGFKLVNDTHGAEFGDRVLRAAALRLAEACTSTDAAARLGGDEFGVLRLLRAGGGEDGEALARRVLASFGAPFAIDGLSVQVGASVGVAGADMARADLPAPKAADLALQKARALGGGRAVVFEPALAAEAAERRALEIDLRTALDRGEFTLEYQPIVALDGLRIVCCEALLRWNHPELGQVPPAKFIAAAERSGLIARIGAWVLRTAAAEAACWPGGVRVAVNVSPLQFRIGEATLPELALQVKQALEAAPLAADRLELEVTESAILEADAQTLATLERLRAMGVRIALDDFGIGYASLGYLDRFPFDALKVDRLFLRDPDRPQTAAILKAVARLAADLGMQTVAEGVETAAQEASLRRLGYSCAQGFRFARPLGTAAIRAALARQHGERAAPGAPAPLADDRDVA